MRLNRRPPVVCCCIVMALTGFARGAEESTTTEVSTTSEAVAGQTDSGLSMVSRVPFTLSLAVDGGYDTNVNNTSQGSQGSDSGSGYSQARANLSYDGGTQRTHFTLTLGMDLTYYFQGAADPNPEVNTRVLFSLRHSVSTRLLLGVSLDAEYQAEPDFSADVGPNRRAGYFFTTNDGLSATYAWTSVVSTVTTENFRLVKYDNSVVGAFSGSNRKHAWATAEVQLLRANRAGGRISFEIVDYDQFSNDSTSHYFLGGIEHSFSERANISLRGGATSASLFK